MKKEYKHYIIFIITLFVVVISTTRFRYLFGSNTDWVNQHIIFTDYFREIFYKTGKLLPNLALNYGGGQNIFNLSYYGLLSPIMLPSFLMPHVKMFTYVTVVDLLIIITSCILFYKWLKNNDFDDNVCLTSTLILELASCFIFHMHRHVMFVNYMPFLIMCLMGVDKYFKNKNKTLLIIGVFLMIMTSYYYSVCGIIVIGIYYLYNYFKKSDITIKKFTFDTAKFIGVVLLGILLAAFFLLPTAYPMLTGRIEASSNRSIISLLKPSFKIHSIFSGTYSIGTSIIGFVSLLYLIFTKKKNNVIASTLTLIVLFIPIFMYLLNGGLYLREKCFIPFLPLIAFFIAYFLDNLFQKKINLKHFIIYLLIVCTPLYFYNKMTYSYLILIGIIILLFFFEKKYVKQVFTAFIVVSLLTVTIIENNKEETITYQKYSQIFDENVAESIEDIYEKDKNYFRMNSLRYPTKTVNKIYNERYFTTNIYSSNYNHYYLDFVRKVFKTSSLDYNYFLFSSPNDVLFNSFMGVKYVVSDYNPGIGYQKVNEHVYENTNVLPMFYARNNILNEEDFDKYEYPYNLELLLNNAIVKGKSKSPNMNESIKEYTEGYKIINNKNVIYQEGSEGQKVLKVETDGELTLRLNDKLENKLLLIMIDGLKSNSCKSDNISMKINNVENILTCRTWTYPNKNNVFKYIISDDIIETLKIKLTKGTYNIDSIKMYTIDYDYIDNLKDSVIPFQIDSFKNDVISGTISTKEDSYFVTTLPYDKGYKIYVDDQQTDYEIINKAFVGFKLDKGAHNIKIKYSSPWLKEGMILSLLSLIPFAFVIVSDIKNKKCTLK